MEKLPGSSWMVMRAGWGAVIGERVQEDKWHHFGQSLATDRPAVTGSSLYKYKSLGSILGIIFLRENSAQIVREKPRERDQRLKEKPCVKACSVLAKAWLWKTRLVEMDTRQKEKEKEKKVAQGDRTPKVSGVNREPSALADG